MLPLPPAAPVIFLLQNNGWAISTPRGIQSHAPDLAARAPGYGFPGVSVDGNDLRHVRYGILRETRAACRKQDVSRSPGPGEIAGQRHHDHRRESARGQGITLDNDHRALVSGARADWSW